MVIGIDKEEDHVYFIISNTYTNLLLAPLLARHKQVDLQTGFSGNLFTRGVGWKCQEMCSREIPKI